MSREDDLPSWDEFGAEQLDYGEGEEDVAAPGDDPGDPGEEPSCSSSSASSSAAARTVPTSRIVSASLNRAAAAAIVERDIGPSLPPGFDVGGGADDDDEEEEIEDPEDPGDPGMLQPTVDEMELAPTLPSVGGPSLPIDEPTAPATAAASAARLPAPAPLIHAYGPAAPPPEPAPRPTRALSAAAAPLARVFGPAFPPDLLPFEANGGGDEEEEVDGEGRREEEAPEQGEDAFGPALPPGMNGGDGAATAVVGGGSEMEMPSMDEEDDSEVIGPMPARADGSEERAAEMRRAYLKAEKEREDKKVKREEWMLQLPKKLNSYGLGPRSFSKSNGTDGDSSAWTNGPGSSAAASDQPGTSKEALEKLVNAQRDSAQARIASSLNAGRNESMLDSHSRKRKAGEEEVAGPSAPAVRRPFDIEKDMQVRGLKSASTAEIKEKCGQLSSRFGNSGSTSKYL